GNPLTTDLAGNARFSGSFVDLGAYEYRSSTPIVAPEATGTIADVSAAFGKTVKIDLTKYFSEGDWTYSVQFATDASDALAAEPVVENGVLKLTFVDEATYLEEIEIKDGQKTVQTYKGLTLDLSDVGLVVTASTADGSASADSNAFNVGLAERYSARVTAVLTEMSSDDAWDKYKANKRGGPYGADAVPESETFEVAAGSPISLQIWAEDFASLRGLTLQSNDSYTFILRLENATLDLEDLYEDDGFYSEYYDSFLHSVKTSQDGGYSDLQANEYWISFGYNFLEDEHGVSKTATLLASLPLVPTGDGPVSATLEASWYPQDNTLRRRFDDESHSVDASQVEFVNATTAATSAAVSNAEIAAAETTETRAAVLRDVLLANNVAGGEGVVYVAASSSAALLVNATVVDNDAAVAAFVSAANGSQAVDSIFVGNGLAVSGVELQTVLTDDGAEGAIAYDASKPLFADAENGDYSLAKNAQVIDLATGTTASKTDLAGADRVSGAAADLGAYEYQGVAPSAPVDVAFGSYDAANQSATLTWTDVADETGYRVEVKNADGSWTLVETLAADATSYDATDLAANATYEYRVTAFNNFGASDAVVATVSTLIAPTAPTGLVFTNYDAANARLTMKWVDNADNESIYVAVALVGSQNWKTEKLDADATGCVFTSVDPSKSYVFRVYASNAAGDSDYIEATFNASTDVLTGLSFSTDAPKVGEELAITVAPTTANVALQWFRVDADGSETAIEGATAATYVPTTADLGFTLKVVATGLNAAYASTVSASTGAVEEKLTAPAAPTDVAFGAYDADSQSATLTWTDVADNETGYRVEAKVDGSWSVVATLAADATSYVAEDLAAGATYEYRVLAFNAAGDSVAVEASIATPKPLTVPAAPKNVAFGAYDADSQSATLTWTDVADNETGYRV
ncbi:MAG: fibronectin type III domain-containing protein, partial [Thermoguttaceae bacterium]|nr:fibronectin type III domain-containing protein [Thermoguttaceae bacterium]